MSKLWDIGAVASRTLETFSFDNTKARLPEAFHAKLNPTPFSEETYLLVFNIVAAALICCRRRSLEELG